ncbi:MAG: hypothetical protein IH571_05380, partial [Acholeplasmataceae bacterium]|nr:hypothetical protein [Acholeplasmataceae bacterium]
IQEIQNQMNKRFEDIFIIGVKEGIVHPKTAKPYTREVISAIISGLLYQYVNDDFDISENDLFNLILNQTLRVLND